MVGMEVLAAVSGHQLAGIWWRVECRLMAREKRGERGGETYLTTEESEWEKGWIYCHFIGCKKEMSVGTVDLIGGHKFCKYTV